MTYAYTDPDHVQAVTAISGGVDYTYAYDKRGNMDWKKNGAVKVHDYTFDTENRLSSVLTNGTYTMSFAYDAEGDRVKTTRDDGTILRTPFPGYEVEDPPGSGANDIRTTYTIAGRMVAVKERAGTSAGTLYHAFTDHLGSVAALGDSNGNVSGSLARYDPFGNYRTEPATTVNPGTTNQGFTGHRHSNTGVFPQQDIGLIYMNARYYMPDIGRFISADTIVPDPQNPQSYNRYTYTLNNPVNYTDPSGHRECIDQLCDVVWNEFTDRPAMNGPVPPVIAYIYEEMIQNATGDIAAMIRYGNFMSNFGFPVIGNVIAYGVWASQVMDANVKAYLGPLSPFAANWDHKPILKGEFGPSPVPEIAARNNSSRVGSRYYRYDIWSNIHYGFVGSAVGFSGGELTDGAGLEQVGTDIFQKDSPESSVTAPSWLSSWDDPSDTASIQIGIGLWNGQALNVTPADLYLAVLDEVRLCSTECLGEAR